jgi:hypothetical protein
MSFQSDQKKIDRKANKLVKQQEKDLKKIYKASLKQIKLDMQKIVTKAGEFTQSEMLKFNRLDKLYNDILNELKTLNIVVNTTTKGYRRKIVNNVYNETVEAVESVVDRSLKLGRLDPKLLRQFTNESIPNSDVTVRDLLIKNHARTYDRMKIIIGTDLAQGQSFFKTTKKITNELGIAFNNSLRIARTEALRAKSKSLKQSFDDMKDKGFEFRLRWLPDPRPTHRPDHSENMSSKLNEFGDKKDMFKLGDGTLTTMPRLTGQAIHDINCVCSVVADIED